MSRRRYSRKAFGTLAGLQHAIPQSVGGVPLPDFRRDEEGGPEGSSELTGRERYRVEYHVFKTRPLDSDNLYVKALTDELRYHKLIPEDDPATAGIFVRQWKVKHRNQEGTRIVIRKIS